MTTRRPDASTTKTTLAPVNNSLEQPQRHEGHNPRLPTPKTFDSQDFRLPRLPTPKTSDSQDFRLPRLPTLQTSDSPDFRLSRLPTLQTFDCSSTRWDC